MKVYFYGLMVLVFGFSFPVLAETHIFSDKDGRSIEAELVRYDESGSQVTIKRAGSHKSVTVPISVFSDADQQYIRLWGTTQDFQGNKIEADIRRLNKKVGDYATSASTEVYTDHWFKIEFDNKTYTTFENLELEYVLYYEQEHHISRGHDVENQIGTFYKKEKITLPARQALEFETEPVKLYTWKTNNLKPVAAEMTGIRVRLTLTLDSGETAVREFSYPDGLHDGWVSTTTDAQVKKNYL